MFLGSGAEQPVEHSVIERQRAGWLSIQHTGPGNPQEEWPLRVETAPHLPALASGPPVRVQSQKSRLREERERESRSQKMHKK